MNYEKRGSQARGVYHTSRMRTTKVKQDEEADTRMIAMQE